MAFAFHKSLFKKYPTKGQLHVVPACMCDLISWQEIYSFVLLPKSNRSKNNRSQNAVFNISENDWFQSLNYALFEWLKIDKNRLNFSNIIE